MVMYLDNDAARSGFIKMRGATDIGDIIVQDAAVLEAESSFRPWFGRVLLHQTWQMDPVVLIVSLLKVGVRNSQTLVGKFSFASGLRHSAFS